MLLRDLFEDLERTGKGKSAVVGWGRGMGHKGHMFLASSVITQSKETNSDPYFVVSRTVGKDDPITPDEKLAIYKKVFPQSGHIFQTATEEMPDLTRVLSKLQSMGYTDVTVVVGADQVKALAYVKNYNGKPDKSGNILFNFNTLNVISRQETTDPSRNQEGPRATPMRDVLKDPAKSEEEKFAIWRDAMSPELSDDEVRDLMNKAGGRMAALSAPKPKKAKAGEQKLNRPEEYSVAESWSQKYKSSINCSHPRGFSQKAHCAGKKNHNEGAELEMTCEDCGMCQSHGSLNEIKKGQKDSNGFTKCWSGYHAAGTKKSSTTGKQVRNCVSNEDVSKSKKRCSQCGMTNCTCAPGKCKCKPVAGWIPNKGFKKAPKQDMSECVICAQCKSDPCICDDSHGFVNEERVSAAVRMQRAADQQRAKSNASLKRTPSSIPKSEPKKDEKVSEKIKGADGKACWDGYRYNGTGNGKDKCVKVSEDIENIMAALIERILVNEAIQDNKR